MKNDTPVPPTIKTDHAEGCCLPHSDADLDAAIHAGSCRSGLIRPANGRPVGTAFGQILSAAVSAPVAACCGPKPEATKDCCPTADEAAMVASDPVAANTFRIATMDCGVEESEIRRIVEPIAGVRGLYFQLPQRTVRIDASEKALPTALDAIRKAGFVPEPVTRKTVADAPDHQHVHGFGAYLRLFAALVIAVAAEAVSYFAPETTAWSMLGMAIAAVAIYFAGWETYAKGMAAIFNGKLNISALMSVAVTGAFLIGQWPEAAMVMALYAIAELIEAKAVERARNAIAELLQLAPEVALMRTADGAWMDTPSVDVALGATIRVKPGERVPLDGIVTKGSGAIDQAPITGESIPVDKAPGDQVFAGTINQTGELEIRVTAAASDTTLARIIESVEQAQGTRAPTQRFVDKFSAVYTPMIFVIAVLVAVSTPFLLNLTWLEAIYKALVLLVIACPCALVISTPVTVVSGLSAAARRGILIKGGVYLEGARLLKAVALDKTGTITEGKPKLVAWKPWDGADEATVKHAAASLAARSDHPVSQAIAVNLADAAEVHDFKALPGRGVEGTIDGRRLLLSNHRTVHEAGICSAELEAALDWHAQQGRTLTLLSDDTRVLALFAVADTIKESSKQAVADLLALGVTPVMLTGDNAATAKAIAAQAGILDARSDLLPEAKLLIIQELQRQYGATGMTGDGINDAPALAQADIGFAMGAAGTDTAMEAADVVIMNDSLGRVAETVRLSKRTHVILWQNITLALGIKSVFLVLAVFGTATMWMAVFADMGASLLVVGNGLRLLAGTKTADRGAKPIASGKRPAHDLAQTHAHDCTHGHSHKH